jgi:uncharacterized protein (DUF302 family)
MKMRIEILFVAVVLTLFLIGCGKSGDSSGTYFVVDKVSDFNRSRSVALFSEALEGKNYQRLYQIDHEEVAKEIKKYLRPTTTFTLNNPKISTKLIECNPSMALELPIRVTVYRELSGKVHLIYTNPEYWSIKHNIKDKECINLLILIARDFDLALLSLEKKRINGAKDRK